MRPFVLKLVSDLAANPRRFVRSSSEGQDLVEYALLAAFISMAVVGGSTLMGRSLEAWFTAVANVAAAEAGPSGASGNTGSPGDESSGNQGKKSNCGATGSAASNGTC